MSNLKDLSDEELFLKSDQNPEYFGEIIDRYQNKLDRYISRISNLSKEDREDLIQDIFLTAYQKIYSFEEGERFSPWIYRIAHNKTIDFWRKNKKKEEISVDENLVFVESQFWKNEVLEEIENLDNQKILKELFQKLDLKYREVIILRFEEEKSYEEISEILKIPKSTVGTLINRAKKKLKEEYQKLNQ